MTLDPTTRWFGPRSGDAARLRLFCFPFAGGGASAFRAWPAGLPPEVAVCPARLPGREHRLRDAPVAGMADLIDALSVAIEPLLDRPFALFGHSMGGRIAWELACALRRRLGREPVHLFVSACRPPHVPNTRRTLHDLPEPEFAQEIRRLGGTPPELWESPTFRQIYLPILRADFTLCETHAPTVEPPLDAPITAFAGADDTIVPAAQLDGWAGYTRSGYRLRMFPGDHFFLRTAEADLLRVVGGQLRESR